MQIRKPAAVAVSRLLSHSTSLRVANIIMSSNVRGIAMILSPAKTLDLTPISEREFAYSDVNVDIIEKLSNEYALPLCDDVKTTCVVSAMKNKSEAELKALLKLSPAFARSSREVSILRELMLLHDTIKLCWLILSFTFLPLPHLMQFPCVSNEKSTGHHSI